MWARSNSTPARGSSVSAAPLRSSMTWRTSRHSTPAAGFRSRTRPARRDSTSSPTRSRPRCNATSDPPPPQLVVEPGRAIVGTAGTIRCEVVSVRTGTDGRRWVYLDIGRYGGLAETENEYIRYRLRTGRDGDPVEDAVVAGPTCDGDDVLYRRYPLPVTLRAGDAVEIGATGAYTASYASTSFNGFSPLTTHFVTATDAIPAG